nr:MAG TPA: hypothetical protein [Caudoviricetes sp.]
MALDKKYPIQSNYVGQLFPIQKVQLAFHNNM